MDKFFIFAIISGVVFGLWPNLASKAQLPNGVLMIYLSLPMFIIGIITLYINKENFTTNNNNALFIALFGLTLNAIAFLFYGPVIKNSFQTGSTLYIVIAIVITIITAALYEIIAYKKPLDLNKVLGLILIIVGIFLIKKQVGST